MEVIKETLWKRCLSTPTKPPAKNINICLSETAYQHKGTREKCKKTIQAAIIQWLRQCLMYKPHHIASPDRSRKQATFLSRVPVHYITPFCSDALVSPPNLYPPWLQCQETVYWSYPILPFGIVACTVFPTTFLEIAVYGLQKLNGAIGLHYDKESIDRSKPGNILPFCHSLKSELWMKLLPTCTGIIAVIKSPVTWEKFDLPGL